MIKYPIKERARKCCYCDQEARFFVLAHSLVAEDLFEEAGSCRQHAIELARGRCRLPLMIDARWFKAPLDQRYRDGCDCVPAKLNRCARCKRLADVRLTAGKQEDFEDPDRGLPLCGSCSLVEPEDGSLPVELREELKQALDHEEEDPCPF